MLRFLFFYITLLPTGIRKSFGQDSTQIASSRKIGLENLGVSVLDFRSTWFGGRDAVLWGTNAGYIYGEKKNKLAIGLYTASYNKTRSLVSLEGQRPSVNIMIPFASGHDLYFVNLLYLKGWIWHKHWILATPFEIGLGSAKTFFPSPVLPSEGPTKIFVPVQAGVNFDYRYSRWFGVGVRGGYRTTLYNAQESVNFSGFYYTFGLSVYGDVGYDLLKMIKKKKKQK